MYTTLLSFGALQGFFLAAILFIQKRGDRIANRILGILLLLLSSNIAFFLMTEFYEFEISVSLFLVIQSLPLLYGPLLYFYTNPAGAPSSGRNRFIYHFLPAACVVVLSLLFLLPGPGAEIEALKINHGGFLRTVILCLIGSQLLHMLFYNVLILRSLNSDKKITQGNGNRHFSTADRWYRQLIKGYSFFLMIMTLFYLSIISGLYYSYKDEMTHFVILAISIFIHAIAFKTYLQPEIISDSPRLISAKYNNVSLSQTQKDQYRNLLESYMEQQKPYHASELKLNDLAGALSIQAHIISRIINEQFGQNFFDFINSYRIEEAKQRLNHPESQETILAIAFDVGFNSKTAFNRAFKKHTRMTPSQFKQRCQ